MSETLITPKAAINIKTNCIGRYYTLMGHQSCPKVENRKTEACSCFLTLVGLNIKSCAYGSSKLHKYLKPL